MAAEIRPVTALNMPKTITPERPILISRIDGNNEIINDAKLLFGGSTIISVCDDKSLRIWQRRDSGNFWPSVCHFLPSSPSCLHYTEENRKIFVGVENGTIMEFDIANDCNSVHQKRDYLAHQSTVTGVVYARNSEWVISTSKDKFLVYHSTSTGRRLGGHQCTGICTTLDYDALSSHAFVGDYSGQIVMLKLEESGPQVITSLQGHNGSIRSLSWDPESKILFSGSFDQTIIVWDVGGGKGTAYELQGHMGKVTSLQYVCAARRLVSGGEDGMVVSWDMSAKRIETPEWTESDTCQQCTRPFFWNLRAMYDQKQIGIRQHHCRKCGKAVCDTCSAKRTTLPQMGFEFEVRVCDPCHQSLKESDLAPLAKFQEAKHNIIKIDIDFEAKIILTVGKDRVMKMWDASLLLQ